MTNIDFMGKRLYAAILSTVLLSMTALALFFNGLNWGLDFTGGAMVEVGFPSEADPQQIRSQLADLGTD